MAQWRIAVTLLLKSSLPVVLKWVLIPDHPSLVSVEAAGLHGEVGNNRSCSRRFPRAGDDAGVDIFHCSQRRLGKFEGSDLNLAGWVKKLTGKPTITVGSVSLDADFIPDPGEWVSRQRSLHRSIS